MYDFPPRDFSKFEVNKMPQCKYLFHQIVTDILLRLLLFCLYAALQVTPPFRRVIHPEEVWLYRNPMTESYCPMNVLWEVVVVIPSATIFANYIIHRERNDVIQAFLAFSLIISLNGALTNLLKVVVGRPRPDFYYRCFPSGGGDLDMKQCTGDINVINDGLKSFPSGHSSVAFATLGFLSLYLAGKMHLFSHSGKGTTWKLLLFVSPIMIATVIALSRMCDYHHHWQDVFCGSLLGFSVCWLCYHNYYPPLTTDRCDIPWICLKPKDKLEFTDIKQV